MANNRINKEVKIVFLDHTEDAEPNTPFHCVVYGKIINEDKNSYTVVCWNLEGDVSEETVIANRKTYTIVKSTILEMWQIEKFKSLKLSKTRK